MVHSLDPRYPILWRSPDSLQVGLDRPVLTLTNVSTVTERVIAALVRGVSDTGVGLLARQIGVSEREVDEVLTELTPAMAPRATAESPSPPRRVIVDGTGPTAQQISEFLTQLGVEVVPSRAPVSSSSVSSSSVPSSSVPSSVSSGLSAADVDLVVLVAQFVIPPARYGGWLRRDIPHLPVVYSDTCVSIGPLVEPGTSACLYCVERARVDQDSSWPAIASQLMGRRALTEIQPLVTDAALRTARLVRAWLTEAPPTAAQLTEAQLTAAQLTVAQLTAAPPSADPGTAAPAGNRRWSEARMVWHVDAVSGRSTRSLVRPHPECGCRSLTETVNVRAAASVRSETVIRPRPMKGSGSTALE